MKDLQDLWNEISENPLEEDDLEAILSRKSISEVDRFKRLLYYELYVSWGLTILLFFMYQTMEKEIIMMVCIPVVFGSLLNIITLKKLKQLQLMDDVKSFLKKSLKVLKAFMTGFILTIQVVGILVIATLKFLRQDQISWVDWFLSEQGIILIVLFVIIEVILISYAWIFYYTRIRSLKRLLEDTGN